MKKFYDRHELAFAIICIIVYVNVFSIADNVSRKLGVEKLVTFPVSLLMSIALFCWLRRHGLFGKYGLCPPKAGARQFLYYIPLLLLVSCNAWLGLRMNMDMSGTLFYIGTMLCVGFLEEVIFRGLLFKAMCKDGVKSAIAVSSITFGIGHIVNLFNGSGMDVFSNLCQICSAVVIGFLFVVIFWRGGSILPCIAAHSGINMLSAFAVEPEGAVKITVHLLICLVAAGYALILLKTLPKKE